MLYRIGDREGWSETSVQSNRGQLRESAFVQPRVLTIALPFHPPTYFTLDFEI